jgi:hypothetical protein
VVVVVRERGSNTLPAVFKSEASAMNFLRARVAPGTILNADEAPSWEELNKRFEVRRINHQEAYSMDGACTNWAEEFFSRMRRAEIGHHHHIAGAYLLRYAQEASWREDNRRASNGDQVSRIAGLAMVNKPSVDFTATGNGMKKRLPTEALRHLEKLRMRKIARPMARATITIHLRFSGISGNPHMR